MKTALLAAAAAFSLGAAGAAFADQSQLAASAGLSAQQASGLTLDQVARHKFNRGARGEDRIAVVVTEGAAAPGGRAQLAAAAGVDPAGMSLSEIAAAKIRAEARGDDRQPVVVASDGAMGSGAGAAQLGAAAGVGAEVARSMSVNDLYLEIVRQSDRD